MSQPEGGCPLRNFLFQRDNGAQRAVGGADKKLDLCLIASDLRRSSYCTSTGRVRGEEGRTARPVEQGPVPWVALLPPLVHGVGVVLPTTGLGHPRWEASCSRQASA